MIYTRESWDGSPFKVSELALMMTGARSGIGADTHLLCPDEQLADEALLSSCSGVLIAPDVMITAGHCIDRHACDTWEATSAYDSQEHLDFPADSIAACQEVLATLDDVAVVRLDSQLAEEPAKLRLDPITDMMPADFVGHPLGTPTKVDTEAIVTPHLGGGPRYKVAADAFQGSSGGGVFDKEGNLVAILTAGLPDFDYDEDAECMKLLTYDGPPAELAYSPIPILRQVCEDYPDEPFCEDASAAGWEQPEEAAQGGASGAEEMTSTEIGGTTQGADEPQASSSSSEPAGGCSYGHVPTQPSSAVGTFLLCLLAARLMRRRSLTR